MRLRFRDDSTLDVWAVVGLLSGWLAMVAILWLLFGDEARAQAVEPIEVRFDAGTIRGAPGSVHPVGAAIVPAGFVCDVVVEAENNRSEHNGTDVLVEDLVIADVEAVAMTSGVVGSGTVVSDGLIEVAIRVGEDGVVSAGISVVLDCGPPPSASTTTTSSPTSSSTTVPDTTTTSTTLSPPPVGAVPAGGGAMAAMVGGSDPSILAIVLIVGGVAASAIAALMAVDQWRDRRRR